MLSLFNLFNHFSMYGIFPMQSNSDAGHARPCAGHGYDVGLSVYAYAFYFRLSDYYLRMNDAV
jgi:hypothetical protein